MAAMCIPGSGEVCYVIADCDQANVLCPVFPGAKRRLHWSFPDPSAVQGRGRQHEFNAVANAIHDELRRWLSNPE